MNLGTLVMMRAGVGQSSKGPPKRLEIPGFTPLLSSATATDPNNDNRGDTLNPLLGGGSDSAIAHAYRRRGERKAAEQGAGHSPAGIVLVFFKGRQRSCDAEDQKGFPSKRGWFLLPWLLTTDVRTV